VISVEGDAVSPMLVQSIQFVRVNADEKAGDVYHDPRFAPLWMEKGAIVPAKTRYALTAQAIGRIAANAGVKWIPEQTGMIPGSRERRPNGHVYLRYKATGAVRQPNGEWYWEPTEVEIDTQDEAEEIAATYRRQIRDGRNKYLYGDKRGQERFTADDVAGMVEREIMQLRKFVLRHAETKAKTRAIRRLLSLPQTFSHEEIERPFAVPRLLYRPDFADPLQLEQAQIEGQRAERSLYGGLPELGTMTSPAGAAPAGAGVETSSRSELAGDSPGKGAEPAKGGRSGSAPPKPGGGENKAEDPTLDLAGSPHHGKRFSWLAVHARKALEDVQENARSPKLRAIARFWFEQSPASAQESSAEGAVDESPAGAGLPDGLEPHSFVGTDESIGCAYPGCGWAIENPIHHAGQAQLLEPPSRRSRAGH
jgi:hypothetical protein